MGFRKNMGASASQRVGMRLTIQAARRLSLALAILCITTLALGAGFIYLPRAGATPPPYDVCASGCTYVSINDAIAAAASGATITVGPGVYGPNEVGATTPDTSITINKAVTLQGAGQGVSIINDAPANQNTATAGVIKITTPSTPGNITVSGFTIEGAVVNDSNDDGILMTVGDTNASDVITIQNNSFYGDTTLDPQLLADQTDAIYVANSTASTDITNNNFQGVFRAALIEGNPGAVSFTGNDVNLHALYDLSTTPATLQWWAEGLLFLGDSTSNISSPQVVSGNTFENYPGMGVGVDAGYKWGLVGAYSNMSITSNTFNDLGVAGTSTNPADAADIFLHGFGTTSGSVTSTISGVTISGNTFNLSSSSGHGYGIGLMGSLTGTISIDHNTLQGSGSSRPLAGINFNTVSSTANVSITNNIIRGFVNGGAADTLPSGAQVNASQNCIAGNSTYGFLAAGGSVNAQHNWWGSPYGPGTTLGYGNPVSTHVDASNFLTTPAQSACGGPVTSNVQSTSNPVTISTHYTLSATLDTTSTSNLPVASAYYRVDGGLWHSLSATSGTFNTSQHVVVSSGTLTSASAPGTHQVCVMGIDTAHEVGTPVCITLNVVYPTVNTTTTITSSVNPSLANQSVTFTITVASPAGTPTGSVTLTDGATTLAGPLTLDNTGAATFTTSALSVGTHPLVAAYAGDASGNPIFQASTSATLNQVVNKVDTTTTLTATPNPSVSGQTVTFSVTVQAADSSTPSGTVTLTEGANTLGTITLASGAGAFTISTLSIGTHNISAAYSGDTTHNTSSGSATATVTERPTVPTGTTNAYIRFVQASEDYTSADIALDGKVSFPNVAACTAQAYFPITAGKHTITVQVPSGGTVVITQSLTLSAGAYYTLAIVGNSAKSISPALLVFADNNTVTPNQASVRIYHLSDTLGNVLAKTGSTVLAANLTFAHATGYNAHSPETATYSFQPVSGPAVTDTLKLEANQVYSIFLLCDGQAVNAAAAGVPQSLPQTGYGPWLTTQDITILLIVAVLLLLAGSIGFGSYAITMRRRNSA